ncbi:MAG: N-acetylmuramoyl-L-alanine amidase [Paenibacillus sp.]|jgi:N-acetylmuramoyl-L-alanine amidase|nr:N-acetylmuramoyl-L-alanine amidase [Paenibacillus sp.]
MKRSKAVCLAFLTLSFMLLSTGAAYADKSSPVSTVDVLIDVGHGGIDGGTSHGDLLEKHLNLMIGKMLYDRLRQMGVCVALNRSRDYAPSDDNDWLRTRSRHLRDLAQRKLLVDVLKPKLTVSLHTNWAKHSSARGPGVLYQYTQPSFIAAHLFSNRLNALYGTTAVPYVGKTFYLLNRSRTPAIIVEMGYISNPSDRKMLSETDGQNKITEALASAVVDYLFFFHVE